MRHCAREPGSPRTSRGQGFQRPLVQGIPAGTRPPAPGDHAHVRVGRPPFPQRACVCAWVQSGPVYGNRAEGEDGRRAWRSAVLLLPPGVHLLRGTSSRRRPPRRGRWGRFLKCRGHLRSVPQRTRRGCCGGFGSRCLMQAAHPHASEPEPKRARERACAVCVPVPFSLHLLFPFTVTFLLSVPPLTADPTHGPPEAPDVWFF